MNFSTVKFPITFLIIITFHANIFAATQNKPFSAITVEAETGIVLYEENADIVRPPASMIKLMQMLLVSEGLDQEKWTLNQTITASRKAQHMGGTQVYLEAGDQFALNHLMKALAVASANDAAMAIAEGLWGNEENYLKAMNQKAAQLGMINSEFHSVHGLPPDRGEEFDQTTARDMTLLARACVQHPRILEWTSMRELQFRPGEAKKYTTNKLIRKRADIDGLKTGYIRAAGFCITATLEKNDIRVITVIMGHENKTQRFNLAEQQLDLGIALVRRDEFLPEDRIAVKKITVQNCPIQSTQLGTKEGITLLTRRDDYAKIELLYKHPKTLNAPLKKGDKVGTVTAMLGTTTLAERDLLILEDLPEVTWKWKIQNKIKSWLGDD